MAARRSHGAGARLRRHAGDGRALPLEAGVAGGDGARHRRRAAPLPAGPGGRALRAARGARGRTAHRGRDRRAHLEPHRRARRPGRARGQDGGAALGPVSRRQGGSMLQEGKKAPAFKLESSEGEKVSLDDFQGKTVVLYFYPKDDTPGCTREAQGFRDAAAALKKKKAVVLGVSRDRKSTRLNSSHLGISY